MHDFTRVCPCPSRLLLLYSGRHRYGHNRQAPPCQALSKEEIAFVCCFQYNKQTSIAMGGSTNVWQPDIIRFSLHITYCCVYHFDHINILSYSTAQCRRVILMLVLIGGAHFKKRIPYNLFCCGIIFAEISTNGVLCKLLGMVTWQMDFLFVFKFSISSSFRKTVSHPATTVEKRPLQYLVHDTRRRHHFPRHTSHYCQGWDT